MLNYFVALIFASIFSTDTALKFTTLGDFDASNAILNNIKITRSNSSQYYFLKASNAFALSDKQEALKWLNLLEGSFEDIPIRYQTIAYLMQVDIKAWSEGDLGEIGREMRISKDRLKIGKSGSKTQDIQTDIVSKLDRLIKSKEDQANGGDPKDAKNLKESQNPIGKNTSDRAAIEEIIAHESGKGTVDEKKLKTIAEKWGTMSEKERAKVINGLTRDLPARYRVVIEDYFKALAKVQTKTQP